jgi:hypothetical protein
MTARGFLKLFSDHYVGLCEHLSYEPLVENCFPEAIKNFSDTIYKKQVEIYLEAYDKAFTDFMFNSNLDEEIKRRVAVDKACFDKQFRNSILPPKLEDLI